MACSICGRSGHNKTTCTHRGGGRARRTHHCSNCGRPGHHIQTCPDRRITHHCSNCGRPGHHVQTCPENQPPGGYPTPVLEIADAIRNLDNRLRNMEQNQASQTEVDNAVKKALADETRNIEYSLEELKRKMASIHNKVSEVEHESIADLIFDLSHLRGEIDEMHELRIEEQIHDLRDEMHTLRADTVNELRGEIVDALKVVTGNLNESEDSPIFTPTFIFHKHHNEVIQYLKKKEIQPEQTDWNALSVKVIVCLLLLLLIVVAIALVREHLETYECGPDDLCWFKRVAYVFSISMLYPRIIEAVWVWLWYYSRILQPLSSSFIASDDLENTGACWFVLKGSVGVVGSSGLMMWLLFCLLGPKLLSNLWNYMHYSRCSTLGCVCQESRGSIGITIENLNTTFVRKTSEYSSSENPTFEKTESSHSQCQNICLKFSPSQQYRKVFRERCSRFIQWVFSLPDEAIEIDFPAFKLLLAFGLLIDIYVHTLLAVLSFFVIFSSSSAAEVVVNIMAIEVFSGLDNYIVDKIYKGGDSLVEQLKLYTTKETRNDTPAMR